MSLILDFRGSVLVASKRTEFCNESPCTVMVSGVRTHDCELSLDRHDIRQQLEIVHGGNERALDELARPYWIPCPPNVFNEAEDEQLN